LQVEEFFAGDDEDLFTLRTSISKLRKTISIWQTKDLNLKKKISS